MEDISIQNLFQNDLPNGSKQLVNGAVKGHKVGRFYYFCKPHYFLHTYSINQYDFDKKRSSLAR